MKLNRALVAIGLLSAAYLVIATIKLVEWPPEVGHIATTIVAVLIVHILDHTYFQAEIQKRFESMSARIVADVRMQTEQELEKLRSAVGASVDTSRKQLEVSLNALLADQSASIAAMQSNTMRCIYPNRKEAAGPIVFSMQQPSGVIRLMGVSLNDFFRGDNPELRDAWVKLSGSIQDSKEGELEHEIRVLMINPRSFGAILRSYAENLHTGPMFVGRLKSDVEATLDNLIQLENFSRNKTVRLACRLYNVSPSMFLCHTDARCFVQHYHFWTQRRDATPMAVFEYEDKFGSPNATQMHSELRAHFDVIWDNASTAISDYYGGKSWGIDEAAGQSGLINIYNLRPDGGGRIAALLTAFESHAAPFDKKQHNRGISMQGVSLKSFFSTGQLSDRMYEIIQAGKTDVRVLFLDPAGEQARFRSYREFLLQTHHENIGYSSYTDQMHHESTLYKDTMEAIEQLRAWVEKFSQEPNWVCKVQARTFASAPTAFALQAGDRVLVEPYNYGKIGGLSIAPATLGTDMPLFEFQHEVPTMFNDSDYRKNNLSLRNPFL